MLTCRYGATFSSTLDPSNVKLTTQEWALIWVKDHILTTGKITIG